MDNNCATTPNWYITKNDGEVTCHTRIIGGVLCRWWGDGQPPVGVAILNKAAQEHIEEHIDNKEKLSHG